VGVREKMTAITHHVQDRELSLGLAKHVDSALPLVNIFPDR